MFFLLATQHIAAAEANLIMYLWPGMVVGFGALLGIFHLRMRHFLGIALGFAGAAVAVASTICPWLPNNCAKKLLIGIFATTCTWPGGAVAGVVT